MPTYLGLLKDYIFETVNDLRQRVQVAESKLEDMKAKDKLDEKKDGPEVTVYRVRLHYLPFFVPL